MDVAVLLPRLKAKLGVKSDSLDDRLSGLLISAEAEINQLHGARVDVNTDVGADFVLDFASWKFSNHDGGAMPRHLEYRLRCFWAKGEGANGT